MKPEKQRKHPESGVGRQRQQEPSTKKQQQDTRKRGNGQGVGGTQITTERRGSVFPTPRTARLSDGSGPFPGFPISPRQGEFFVFRPENAAKKKTRGRRPHAQRAPRETQLHVRVPPSLLFLPTHDMAVSAAHVPSVMKRPMHGLVRSHTRHKSVPEGLFRPTG
jgi:hypothetical protein